MVMAEMRGLEHSTGVGKTVDAWTMVEVATHHRESLSRSSTYDLQPCHDGRDDGVGGEAVGIPRR